MPFHHRVTARFFDIDRAGIVFFARYYEYCHSAFESLLAALFGPLEESFQRGLWMMPLVHSEADYMAPVHMGEELDISLQVAHVGDASITFAYDVRGTDKSPRASVRLTHVFVQPNTFKSRSMPNEFRAGLARLGLWPQEGLALP